MKQLRKVLMLMIVLGAVMFSLTSCKEKPVDTPIEKPDVEVPDTPDKPVEPDEPVEPKHEHIACPTCGKCIDKECDGTETDKCEGHIIDTVEPEHEHEFGEWEVVAASTCTKEGISVRYCTKCPESERGVVEKLEHYYEETKVITEATCTQNGSKLFTCAYCKDIKIENIDVLGHQYNGGICTRCNKSEKETAKYTITYELNGGKLENTSLTVEEGTKVQLPNPTKTDYVFEGWFTSSDFKEETKVSKNITITQDICLYAKWNVSGSLVTLNANGGYVELSTIVLKPNTQFTIEVPSTDQYVFFVGWYVGEEKITDEFGICLKAWNISEDVTLIAKYEETKVIDNIKYIYEGEYPQSLVKSETLIKELEKITEPNKRGYLEYNDRQYAKYTYNGGKGVAKFNDGTYLEKGKTYYFLVEPILWRVIDVVNDIVISDKIIDTMYFYESAKEHKDVEDAKPNNYEYSDISSWLNCDLKHAKNNFIYDAFADPINVLMLRKDIDNSDITTGVENNPNACVTTTAFLYLLSYQEFNEVYKLRLNRESKVTDYAIVRGVNVDNYSMNGEWWLRSPSASKVNFALAVSTIGEIFEAQVDNANIGVRPVAKFKKIK